VAIGEALFLFEMLRHKLGGVEGRYVIHRLSRICAASVLMGVPVAAVSLMLESHLPASRAGYIFELGVCMPLGLLLFAASSWLLGIEELSYVTSSLLRLRGKF
jgi:hypothetical protein